MEKTNWKYASRTQPTEKAVVTFWVELYVGWSTEVSIKLLPIHVKAFTLAFQQAPPLAHGNLTSILIGVEIDGCVIHWRAGHRR